MRLAVVLGVMCLSCDRTETTTRAVNLHVTASCPIPTGSLGEYVATGDYNPPLGAQNHSALLATDQPGQAIDGIPRNVLSLALLATPANDTKWLGVSLVPPAGDLDLLLLPAAAACALNARVAFAQQMIFGAVSPSTLIASGAAIGTAQPQGFRVDLATGSVDTMKNGLQRRRLRAAMAMLGSGGLAVVTGGVTASSPVLIDALHGAEIFDAALGDFQPNAFGLAEPRSDHAAVTLASGNVLLVGGKNDAGLIAATELISFDPATSSWRSAESTQLLQFPRLNPYALRLADGTVLVGGGFDASGGVVKDVELLTSTANAHLTTTSLHIEQTRALHAFVALDAGGALLVTAPDTTLGDDPNNFQRAWFITPNGGAIAITADLPKTLVLTDVKLFPASGGAALLWTGSTWLSFDPWSGVFTAASPAPSNGPELSSPIVSADPGLRAWVLGNGSVTLWRDSVRNTFAADGPYLSASGAALTAPDRFPPPAFDSALGVTLDPGSSVFVTDARYRDVAIDVEASAGTLPFVVLRAEGGEIEVGGKTCPLLPTLDQATGTKLHVVRSGAFVSYSLGGPLVPCAMIAPSARVAVGVRGAGFGSHARNLVITRLDPASN